MATDGSVLSNIMDCERGCDVGEKSIVWVGGNLSDDSMNCTGTANT